MAARQEVWIIGRPGIQRLGTVPVDAERLGTVPVDAGGPVDIVSVDVTDNRGQFP